jgi:hypothetical protein
MQTTSTADHPAFPVSLPWSDVPEGHRPRPEDGMSYRHWLIGQIAAGLSANPTHAVSQVATLSLQLTDEIIRRMDDAG